MEDNDRAGIYRIVHLSEVDSQFKDSLPNVVEEAGKFYKAEWIRDTDGKVSEYTSQAEVNRAVSDLCNEVDLTGFTKVGEDISIHETQHGYKAAS